MTYLWVAVGGALGSVARFACSSVAVRWLGAGFPYGTLFVNVTGSFAIGLLAALVASDGRPLLNADARAFLLVGVLGGFTTFSSFSLETLRIAGSGAAALNVVLSVGLCLFGAWLGLAAGGLLSR
jgi:CrcB protein